MQLIINKNLFAFVFVLCVFLQSTFFKLKKKLMKKVLFILTAILCVALFSIHGYLESKSPLHQQSEIYVFSSNLP